MADESSFTTRWKQLHRDLISGNDAQARRAAHAFTGLIAAQLRRLGCSAQDAHFDDVLSSVLEKLWSQGESVQALVSWTHVVTQNTLISLRRKSKRIEGRGAAYFEECAAGCFGEGEPRRPDESVLLKEDFELLMEARQTLEGMQREVIDLLYPVGSDEPPMTQNEVAQTLGVHRYTVGNKQRAAIQLLRKLLRRRVCLGRF